MVFNRGEHVGAGCVCLVGWLVGWLVSGVVHRIDGQWTRQDRTGLFIVVVAFLY